jgi:hypothetical protein
MRPVAVITYYIAVSDFATQVIVAGLFVTYFKRLKNCLVPISAWCTPLLAHQVFIWMTGVDAIQQVSKPRNTWIN